MTVLPDAGTLESQARTLYQARDHAAVSALLDGADREAVIGSSVLAFWHADSLRRLGRGADALTLLEEAAATFARHGNDVLHRHRLNLEGMLYFDRGDISAAEASWRALLADASIAHDEEFVARANNNLGVICTLQERWQEAIACYERALAAYRALGRRRGLAQTHQNLAITYREIDFAPKSDHHFLQAIRYAAADGSEDEIARAEQERALLIYLTQHDATLARVTAEKALARFDRLGDRGGTADTLRVLGMIAVGEGDVVKATRVLQTALERARDAQLPLVEAEIMEALAATLELRDEAELADALRTDAQRQFAQIGAVAWGARTRTRVQRLVSPQSRP